jgi:hypothetical protein
MLAARLKMLGIKALIVHNNAEVGDNWKNRLVFTAACARG